MANIGTFLLVPPSVTVSIPYGKRKEYPMWLKFKNLNISVNITSNVKMDCTGQLVALLASPHTKCQKVIIHK